MTADGDWIVICVACAAFFICLWTLQHRYEHLEDRVVALEANQDKEQE